MIYVCDTVFKPPNSRRRVLATTAQIQLRVVRVCMVTDLMLIHLLLEVRGVARGGRGGVGWIALPTVHVGSWRAVSLR